MSGGPTPGIWSARNWSSKESQVVACQNGDSVHICGYCKPDDARLIAAAPELLEAAERALNYIASTESEMGETMQCGDLLRAAIAKATGAA